MGKVGALVACGEAVANVPPNHVCEEPVSRFGEVHGVERRVWGEDDGGEFAFGDHRHVMPGRQLALDAAVTVVERGQRQFEHHELAVRAFEFVQQALEVRRELCGGSSSK